MASRSTPRGAVGRNRARRTSKKAKQHRSLRQSLGAFRERLRNRLGRQSDDVWGIVLLVVGVLLLLAFFELAGPVGRALTSFLTLLFGLWAYLLPLAFVAIGVALIGSMPRKDYGRMATGLVAVFLGSLGLFHLLTGAVSLAGNIDLVVERGGAVGSLVAFPLRRLIGFWGAFVVLVAVIGTGTLILTRATLRDVGRALLNGVRRIRRWAGRLRASEPAPQQATAAPVVVEASPPAPRPKKARRRPGGEETAPAPSRPKEAKRLAPATPTGDGYTLPPLRLLSTGEDEGHNRRSLEQTAADLEETLRQHGVDARLTRIVPGPTVTRYEIELAPGVKVNRVTTLSHDIAYALASPDVRILAPIPGKSAIGIEVPNRRRRLVTLGDILHSPEATEHHDPLAVGLGMDISGRARLLHLDELPHVLIAGATGAGKSSCINAIVTSILMRATPDEVRLILVDPKRVELGQYNGVPHLLTRVITNPKKASDALQWAVTEMDRRYELLADAAVRDIAGYREKWDAGKLDPDGFDRFPHIVIIVDELNDLMMVAGRAVEDSVVRIAQMARAVGIHLVLATQRPSVNVITGVIKANVPSRLAFSVTSQTDSRVIIDSGGAEKLVGLGDMLVVTAREPRPERIQGAFVTEAEVHDVVAWCREQRNHEHKEAKVFEAAEQQRAADEEMEGEDADLVRQAIDLVVRSQLGSTSMLQRKLRIGFARAGRVMDILERKGIVGPSEGSKAREVLMTVEELESMLAGARAE
jgi:DNA segregation ATPase FtsK/SpoIIIE, S-DNA-T family